jgi:hypothetical protein
MPERPDPGEGLAGGGLDTVQTSGDLLGRTHRQPPQDRHLQKGLQFVRLVRVLI